MCGRFTDEYANQPVNQRMAKPGMILPEPAPEKRKVMRLTITREDANNSRCQNNPITCALKRMGKNGYGVGFGSVFIEGQDMQMSPSLREVMQAWSVDDLSTLTFPVKGILRAKGV